MFIVIYFLLQEHKAAAAEEQSLLAAGKRGDGSGTARSCCPATGVLAEGFLPFVQRELSTLQMIQGAFDLVAAFPHVPAPPALHQHP